MINYYKDILTPEECLAIKEGMLREEKENSVDVCKNTNGLGFYDLPETLALVKRLTAIMSADYYSIKFLNTYTRIYRNGCILPWHIDRDDLDLTLSACAYSDTDKHWPIYVSKVYYNRPGKGDDTHFKHIQLNANSYVTPPGSGVTCIGNKNPHWRDKLECPDDRMIVQTFYHWKFVKKRINKP